MKVNPQIFRAYDIRGLVEKDLTNEVAVAIGKAFGTWLLRNSRLKTQSSKIVVGRDNRFGSDRLSAKLIEGLISTGCQAIDVGVSLTPLIHFATIKYSVEAGVMVTASHNPKEFNGFRLDLKGAMPFFGRELKETYQLVISEDFEKGIGGVSYDETLFSQYRQDLQNRVKIGRPLRVVIDCGNGAASKFAVDLFEALGLKVEGLFCNLDGDFPYHRPDPEMRINLENLRTKVREEKADLGFAFDTDGDRFGLSDEKGNTYENDKVLILLAEDILKRHPGSKVLCDIKSSSVLIEAIRQAGGQALMIKTGHPYFRTYMKAHPDVFLGGELSSHTFIKDNYYGYDDGLYTAARIAEIVSFSARTVSQFFSSVPHTSHTEEIKLNCPDELKQAIVDGVGADFLKMGYQISDVDGFRVNVSGKDWFLIRTSNTSPYISLRFEAENKEKLLEVVAILKEKLMNFPKLDLSVLSEAELLKKAHNV